MTLQVTLPITGNRDVDISNKCLKEINNQVSWIKHFNLKFIIKYRIIKCKNCGFDSSQSYFYPDSYLYFYINFIDKLGCKKKYFFANNKKKKKNGECKKVFNYIVKSIEINLVEACGVHWDNFSKKTDGGLDGLCGSFNWRWTEERQSAHYFFAAN